MRKLLSVFICVLLVFSFSGCTKQESSYDASKVQPNEGFSVKTELEEYKKGTEKIVLQITNDSHKSYTYGFDFVIEAKKDDKWFVMPFKDSVGFDSIARILPAKITESYDIDLSNLSNKLKPGQYRVVFNQTYIAEFKITE